MLGVVTPAGDTCPLGQLRAERPLTALLRASDPFVHALPAHVLRSLHSLNLKPLDPPSWSASRVQNQRALAARSMQHLALHAGGRCYRHAMQPLHLQRCHVPAVTARASREGTAPRAGAERADNEHGSAHPALADAMPASSASSGDSAATSTAASAATRSLSAVDQARLEELFGGRSFTCTQCGKCCTGSGEVRGRAVQGCNAASVGSGGCMAWHDELGLAWNPNAALPRHAALARALLTGVGV